MEGRRRLWIDLASVKENFVSGPWLVCDDFNAILGAHEKKGGAPVCRQSCEEFQVMIDVCKLIHVATKGAEFTWARHRGVRGNVEERLDRCLANLPWLDSWDSFDCCTIPRLCSDHNPIMMTFSTAFGARQSLFRFRRMWRVDANLAALVALQNDISYSGGTDDDYAKEFPSSEEIYLALKDMDPDSALGLDGFNGHFFVSCWATVGAGVTSVIQFFFQHGSLPASFNSSMIILIPKVDHAVTIKEYRPIALSNFVFKIIPKILSLWLGSIALRIISPQQHAFVPGRNIADCIITTSECINLLDSKCHGGNVAIKMDITKAFDTLSWDFILHVLEAFGFPPTFVSWGCASRGPFVSSSILLSGGSSKPRGVHQGDPLSPLLFCLAEEVLNRGISELFRSIICLKSGAPVKEKRRREGNFGSDRVSDPDHGGEREWYWKLPLVLVVFSMSSVSSEEVGRERFEVEKERLGSPTSFRFQQSRGLSLVWIASSRSQEPFHVPGFRREARRRENRREEVLGFSGEGSTDSGNF
ncbi:hypothetical protein ACLB2K_012164 [Fragaria x ananassa]